MPFLPPANEVWGKVIFLHLFVILFTGGACVVAPWGRGAWLFQGGCMVAPGGHAWLLRGGGHAWLLQGGGHAWSVPGLQGGMYGCSGGPCVVALEGCMVALGVACMVALAGAWLLRGGMCGCSGGACVVAPGGWRAWDMTRYGDTINERAVSILLECVLLVIFSTEKTENICYSSNRTLNSRQRCHLSEYHNRSIVGILNPNLKLLH